LYEKKEHVQEHLNNFNNIGTLFHLLCFRNRYALIVKNHFDQSFFKMASFIYRKMQVSTIFLIKPYFIPTIGGIFL